MELLAAIRGLEALNSPKRVRLFSDSQYLVRGMSEWLVGWIRDGRLETPDALANQDLWQQLVPLSRTHQIDWQWVRGHADSVHLRSEIRGAGRIETTTTGIIEQIAMGTVTAQKGLQKSSPVSRRPEEHSSGPIPEQHAGIAILPVDHDSALRHHRL